jgi:hypothetical protein
MKVIKEDSQHLVLSVKYPIWQSILLAIIVIPVSLFMSALGLIIPNLICIILPLVVLLGFLYFIVLLTEEKTYVFDLEMSKISITRQYLFTKLLARSVDLPIEIVTGLEITAIEVTALERDDLFDEDLFYAINLILASTQYFIYLNHYPSNYLTNAQNIAGKIAFYLQVPVWNGKKENPHPPSKKFYWRQLELEIEKYEKLLNLEPENPQIHLEIGLLVAQKRGNYNRRRAIAHLQQAEDFFWASDRELLASETKVIKTLIKWNYPSYM